MLKALTLSVALLAVVSLSSAFPKPHPQLHRPAESVHEPRSHGHHDKPSPKPADNPINVHVVCHTHDDVGWLKTVDEYYVGQNNSIQHAGVQYILDSVIPMLVANPQRKFIYVELAFFTRWWNEQSDSMKSTVKELVANGQLEFINGGWCMNDEATTHYVDIIDQMTLGHAFIKREFNAAPRIGWHIDPFGHSSVQATLFAQMGFDGFFFGRADYQDKQHRLDTKTMEVLWRGSPSLGAAQELFTGLNFNGYGPPDSFCWDQGCQDEPIQDDPNLFDFNIASRAQDFVNYAKWQNSFYRSNNIMFTMGSDFQYENANLWYKNLDKLLGYLADHPELGVNAFYSTPSMYLDAIHAANLTWTVKKEDFFPYADGAHAFWTGYFVSRPAVKGYVRDMSSYLQSCRQLEVINPVDKVSSSSLEQAMGIAQHHDAVSGTEKQHVAFDYAKRLSIGEVECQALVQEAIANMSSKAGSEPATFTHCPLLNESICDATAGLGSNSGVAVLIYNPVHKSRVANMRLAVPSKSFSVLDSNGQPLASQIVSNALSTQSSSQPYSIVFALKLPALGFTTVFLTSASETENELEIAEKVQVPVDTQSISNEYYEVTFDSSTGHIVSITNKETQLTTKLDQALYWYNSSNFGTPEDTQPSGAYIFRPNSSTTFPLASGPVKLSISTGDVVSEAVQQYNSWAYQTVRLYAGSRYIEVEYQIGPIPTDDNQGKEVITRWDTDIASNETWYTDSNGRELRKRVRNQREDWTYQVNEPVSGNYYPMNSGAYIQDPDEKTRLGVLTDRSQSAASIADGSLEMMLHRRLCYDDYRGVGDPLSEPGLDGKGLVIRTRHLMFFTSGADAGEIYRQLEEEHTFRVLPLFSPLANAGAVQDYIQSHTVSASYAANELPAQLHLLTLQRWDEKTILLRLAHQFETGESDLSVPVTVDLATLIDSSVFSVNNVVELTLSANQNLSDLHRLQWNSDTPQSVIESSPLQNNGVAGRSSYSVTMNPMEIRTFAVTIA